jgi:serine/threonine protein kinase
MTTRWCERCERVTVDGHLWCPERDCPAEAGHPVLSYGDFLGDLKVTRLVRVWRTAALYEAERAGQPVLLKVAHDSPGCQDRLRVEAAVLAALVKPPGLGGSFLPQPRSALPELLPPYPVASEYPYGEITFRGDAKVYSVYKHRQGKLLSDLLLENPQLWHYEAAWIVIAVGDVLRGLAVQGKSHLTLTPDMILVDTDPQGYPRPLLLDLGMMLSGTEIQSLPDWPRLYEPAYTAPELMASRRAIAASPAADVYSLGLIFNEALAGRPAFESNTVRDQKIREAVTQRRGMLGVKRPELEYAGVIKVVDRATAASAKDRFETVTELAEALAAIYSRAPAEKRPVPRRLYVLIAALVVAALAILGVAAYVLLQVLLG